MSKRARGIAFHTNIFGYSFISFFIRIYWDIHRNIFYTNIHGGRGGSTHHILAKVEGEDVKESERDCENAEEDVADGKVRNENVPRCHHVLKLVVCQLFCLRLRLIVGQALIISDRCVVFNHLLHPTKSLYKEY